MKKTLEEYSKTIAKNGDYRTITVEVSPEEGRMRITHMEVMAWRSKSDLIKWLNVVIDAVREIDG